jgi:hypothetical protein
LIFLLPKLLNYWDFQSFDFVNYKKGYTRSRWFSFVVFNATFNNISVISWGLVLLVGETEVSGENH